MLKLGQEVPKIVNIFSQGTALIFILYTEDSFT